MIEIMQSMRPKWCNEIISGKKTIDVRKTRPKCDTPFKVDIYCTNDRKIMLERSNYDKSIYLNSNIYYPHKMDCSLNGKVIGEYICDTIYDMRDVALEPTGMTIEQWLSYTDNHKRNRGIVYGWHISDLIIYDTPKELSEFKRTNRTEENTPCAHVKWLYEPCEKCKECNLKRPPQSWCYVERV